MFVYNYITIRQLYKYALKTLLHNFMIEMEQFNKIFTIKTQFTFSQNPCNLNTIILLTI